MNYMVKKSFIDLKDGRHEYKAGEAYPRAVYKPTKARVKELLSDKNKQHTPLIEEVTEE